MQNIMKPQKAKHKYLEDEKKNPGYTGEHYLMLPKLDGWYGYVDLGTDNNIRSNSQRIIPSCADRTRAIACHEGELPTGRLIFEITVDGVPQFEELNGILNRKAVDPRIRLNVHDFIPVGPLAVCSVMDRYSMAQEIVERFNVPWMEMIHHYGFSNNPTQWEQMAEQVIDKGGEGLILKHSNAPYEPGKRNWHLIKIKEECTFDLVVVGMVKGKAGTKYANTLGALIVMDSTKQRFTVSGMSDAKRDEWMAHPERVIGHVVEVKAKNVMKDGSLREPRFKAQRFNKNADDIDEVK